MPPVKLTDCAGLRRLLLKVLGDIGEENNKEDDAEEEAGEVGQARVLPQRRF